MHRIIHVKERGALDGEEGRRVQYMAAASEANRGVQRYHGASGGRGVPLAHASTPQRKRVFSQHFFHL